MLKITSNDTLVANKWKRSTRFHRLVSWLRSLTPNWKILGSIPKNSTNYELSLKGIHVDGILKMCVWLVMMASSNMPPAARQRHAQLPQKEICSQMTQYLLWQKASQFGVPVDTRRVRKTHTSTMPVLWITRLMWMLWNYWTGNSFLTSPSRDQHHWATIGWLLLTVFRACKEVPYTTTFQSCIWQTL